MDPLMSIDQAAEVLGIPAKTLAGMVTARTVPHTRIGKHVRFTDEHLAAIVAAGEEPVAIVPARLQMVRRTHPPSGPTTPPPPPGPPSQDRVRSVA